KAGAEQRLARDVAAGGALLQCRAHHHVLDLFRIDFGARDGLADGMAEQGRALGGVERAAIGLADRGAGGGDDNCVGHERPPVASCCCLGCGCCAGCMLRNSWRESFPTEVRGNSSTKSSAAGSSCLRSLPVRNARRSSRLNGSAPARSFTKAFAASPRYSSTMPITIT